MPDFRNYSGQYSFHLEHSAKGSSWVKHKYVKVIDGIYYYPINYKGGRHVGSEKMKEAEKKQRVKDKKKETAANKEKSESKSESKKSKLTDEQKTKRKERIKRLANEAIQGKYGNGQERMNALGKKYGKVQHRVNVVLLGRKKANEIRASRKGTTATTSTASTTSTKKKTKTGNISSTSKKKKKK